MLTQRRLCESHEVLSVLRGGAPQRGRRTGEGQGELRHSKLVAIYISPNP
jgi:hypothetical protein